MKTLLLSTLLIFVTGIAFAQPPVIQWQTTLGISGNISVTGNSVKPTTDGGFITVGTVDYHNGSNTDYFVAKVNGDGSLVWQKTYGGTGMDNGTSIQRVAGGGYIVAGTSNSIDGDVSGNHGSTDAWIMKLDEPGNIEWQKSYGGTDNDEIYTIRPAPGGYIAVGRAGDSAWVLKLTTAGDVEWQKNYSGIAAKDIRPLNSGYILAGTFGVNIEITHFLVIKIDAAGNTIWEANYGGESRSQSRANVVQITKDSGYIVAGYTNSMIGDYSANHGGEDYLVLKLDSSGTLQWKKLLGGSGDDEARSIARTRDGGYIIGGNTTSTDGDVAGNPGDSCWLAKLDSAGGSEWQKTYVGFIGENSGDFQVTNGGGFILTGRAASTNGGVQDCWIARFTGSGLPVGFAGFSAQKQKEGVLLQWQTATEQNSSMFNIQRGIDGKHFATIGSIKAAGNSTTTSNYSYADAGASSISASTLYYRIEEADADGRKSYTSTAKVVLDGRSQLFTLLANPVHGVIRVASNKDVGTASVRLTDMNGKLIYSTAKRFYASSPIEIPSAQLAAGIYLLTVEGNGVKTTLKVVKE